MNPELAAGHEALDTAYQAAQMHADRYFGSTPPPSWEEPRRRRFGALAGLVLAAATLSGLAAWRVGQASSSALPAAAADDDSLPAGGGDRIRDDSPLAIEPVAAPAVASTGMSTLAVARSGDLWTVDAHAASRLEAAHRLALLSGTDLQGPPEALLHAPPLDLRWRGPGLAQAWAQVLGSGINYALQCRREGCRVWVIAAGEPIAAAASVRAAVATGSAASTGITGVTDAPNSVPEAGADIPNDSTGDAGGAFH